MWDKEFKPGVWYLTNDYKDMYCIVKDGPVFYNVISYGTWDVVFCFPGILGVQNFMESACIYNDKECSTDGK